MGTFLSLVRDLARETGTLAGGPASVSTLSGATGRLAKLAGWINTGWAHLQNDRPDWSWMWVEFTAPLTIGQVRYHPSDLGISERFSRWKGDKPDYPSFSLYDPDIGQADQGYIVQRNYDAWRRYYGIGVTDPNRPRDWAIANDLKTLCFGPPTDKAYVLAGEYRKSVQTLVADTDVPEMPEDYHGAIVYEAMKLMAQSDGDQIGTSNAISEYLVQRDTLYRDCLPEMTIGGDGGYFTGR